MLKNIDERLFEKKLSELRCCNPRRYENVNYKVVSNKDGNLAWRPLSLIHPVLYVNLVRKLTEPDHWKKIQRRFDEFAGNSNIHCLSIPIKSRSKQKDKAEQVLQWWQGFEQRSIELSLKYEWVAFTDITDCYSSIYTHSVAWAIHGRKKAKENRNDKKLLGNTIDACLQDMNQGQTNGIPQGSILMDFISEMVLGYADLLLTEKIEKAEITEYQILRYRDDYRVFVHDQTIGEKVLQLISETMCELGMKLSNEKTGLSNQVVRSSIKRDKVSWAKAKQYDKNLQRHLLLIHDLAQSYPNSGSLIRAMTDFHRRISKLKKPPHHYQVLIAMVVDTAIHNPKVYPTFAAILSHLLVSVPEKDRKRVMVDIVERFDQVPNTGLLQIWLQRISGFHNEKIPYNEKLCNLRKDDKSELWNNDWISCRKLKLSVSAKGIISEKKIKKLKWTIDLSEVELFEEYYRRI